MKVDPPEATPAGQVDVTGPAGGSARLRTAEALARRLDKPMGILGVIFLFVVLGQLVATEPAVVSTFAVVGWLFWAVFVAEFLLRAYIAGFGKEFWRKSWWQVVFLLVPFLRFFRALQALRLVRIARLGRYGSILSAGVRGSRSAGKLLTSRVGWLTAITAVVILGSSQLLYVTGEQASYAQALFESAMAAITGNGITGTSTFSRVIQVLLAIYSVAVFATLAGTLGAYFLRDRSAGNRSRPL